MVEIDDIVKRLSKKYRESLKTENEITHKIYDIETQLNDKNISHGEFLKLSNQRQLKEEELKNLKNYNNGLYDGREFVMKFWKEDDL